MQTAAELVAQVTQLVSFPEVAIQVNDLLADESSSAESIGAIVEQDPALTATLLKVANSSMYGVSGVGAEIDNVAKAFTRIGSREIQELTLGICATRAFTGIPNEIISVEDFWHHSLLCATSARLIARRTRARNAGMVFTAGLLHDIGHLVMFHLIPEKSLEALALCRDEMDADNLYIAEREILGFDHMDVGKSLGERWNWPTALVNCIARHHEPFKYEDCTDAEVIVHVANSLATIAEIESDDLADASPVDERAWERLKVGPDDVTELIGEVNEGIAGMLQIFVKHAA